MVHGKEQYEVALAASDLLFGKTTAEELRKIDERTFLSVFEGVPQAEVSRASLEAGLGIMDALSAETGFLKSNGEARRALMDKCVSVNKETVDSTRTLDTKDLLNDRYVLLQKGKKNYYLIKVD